MPQFIFVDYCQISTIDMLRYVHVDKIKIKDLLGKHDTALSSILRNSDFNEGLTTRCNEIITRTPLLNCIVNRIP